MGLAGVTGVFSRYFIVGFFLPAYAALVSLWVLASSALIPDTLSRHHSETTQVLILGVLAVVAGMLLSGLSYYINRIYEGYPLARLGTWRGFGLPYRVAISLQTRRYDRL